MIRPDQARALVVEAAGQGVLVLSGVTVWALLFGETFAAGLAWFLAVLCWCAVEGADKRESV